MSCLLSKVFGHSHHKNVRESLRAENFAPQTYSCWPPFRAMDFAPPQLMRPQNIGISPRSHRRKRPHNSQYRYGLVHTPVPMTKTIKILDATAAADKTWDKVKNLPAWCASKSSRKKDVSRRAKAQNIPLHIATLMDVGTCRIQIWRHFFLQTCKRRSVLRGDNLKDVSGCKAVVTEEGASAASDTRKNPPSHISPSRNGW